jgi:hypothetical protein
MTQGLARLLCKPALDIDHTSASNTDRLVTQQAIGPFENLSRIPWSGLAADMISNLVNAGSVPGTNDRDLLGLPIATCNRMIPADLVGYR